MGSSEQKIDEKKRFSLWILSKIMIIITIVVGLIGVLSAPSSSPHRGNIINNIAILFMGLLGNLYLIFIFVGIIRHLWLLYKNEDIEKTKEARKFLWYSIGGLILLMIFYSLSITIEIFPK